MAQEGLAFVKGVQSEDVGLNPQNQLGTALGGILICLPTTDVRGHDRAECRFGSSGHERVLYPLAGLSGSDLAAG